MNEIFPSFRTAASRPGRTLAAWLLAGALCAQGVAQAQVDAPIIFGQAGHVGIFLKSNAGGFDHLLEPFMVGGNAAFPATVPTPYNSPGYPAAWIIGTENDSPFTLVGDPGSPRSPTAFDYEWGYFDVLAGQEITLRLTNVMTSRIGGVDEDEWGTIVSQIATGSSSINNTSFAGGSVLGGTPGTPSAALGGGYTNVVFTSATEINVYFEDLDPTRPLEERWQNMHVQLVLTPVPEASTQAMLLAGLLAMGFVVRKRRGA